MCIWKCVFIVSNFVINVKSFERYENKLKLEIGEEKKSSYVQRGCTRGVGRSWGQEGGGAVSPKENWGGGHIVLLVLPPPPQ